ncbi:LamG domain-containing protein, partial [Candidatus Pacebacteria bacterium]|nr:LamG domain-containing protein [Candidatus Paceibacterota bacterium]
TFAFVVAQVTEQLLVNESTTTSATEESGVVVQQLEPEITMPEEEVLEIQATESQELEVVLEIPEENLEIISTSTEEELILVEDVASTSSEEIVDEIVSSTTYDIPEVTLEVVSSTTYDIPEVIPEIVATSTSDVFEYPACVVNEGCQSHALYFDGFGIPAFANGSVIENAQIRISLAAKERSNHESVPQQLRIEYSFDAVSWNQAGMLVIEDELSNGLNGGHFLFALPRFKNTEILSTLQVRLIYEGDPEGLDAIFVDTLWLELSAGTFFEAGEDIEVTDEIEYERELLLPAINELEVSLTDFAAGAEPEFHFTFQSQRNFIVRTFNNLFNRQSFIVENVSLVHPIDGVVEDAKFAVTYHEDLSWSLKMVSKPQELKPGKYQLSIEINENEKIYVDTLEFYWGVLAINTNKSMYESGEDVSLQMAALTDRGDTLCDADLRLSITTPNYTIHHIPVEQGGDCGDNNVTDVPDYISSFVDTHELGVYQISLSHYNKAGVQVHHTADTFEVREYIPYAIERSAPTRIYPPAPYEVTLDITANRSFMGDITERVPDGFVIMEAGSSTIATYPTHSEIVWSDITLEEGESITLSYQFDAPDISPYLYLLGPLDMDGFKELRQWQIASDALGAVALLTGTRTTGGVDLNDTAAAFLWSTSTVDTLYFTHSTSSNSEKLTFNRAGDYLVSLTIPQERIDADTGDRTRVGAEVRVNGTVVPEGYARSAYIRHNNEQTESSAHIAFMLNDISVDDYVEVYVEALTTIVASNEVNVSGQASMYVEYVSPSEIIFAATSTRSVASTSINTATASELEWAETRQDVGFVHSDSVNPEDITISNAGTYFVTVNVPLTTLASSTADLSDQRNNLKGRILLDGIEVPGGQFAQGYMRGVESGEDFDADASIHWSGLVISTTSSQILSVSVEQEANNGEVIVTNGAAGSIYIQEVPSSDIIYVRGTQLVTNSDDWNPAATAAVEWEFRDIYDVSKYEHSTSTNPEDVQVREAGDYFLVYNHALTTGAARNAPQVNIEVNGVPYSGAQTKTSYTRGSDGHGDSSASLVILLENLSASSTINVTVIREDAGGAMDDATDAVLMLWKKASLNLRPTDFTFYDTPFDNIRFSSTTPGFEFSVDDPDGTSDIMYQFSISTSSDFTASTTRTSGTDSGFTNTASSTDVSPFVESDKIRFQLQSGDILSDGTTYFWRVRAQDVTGSGEWGSWMSVQSLTVNSGVSTPEWHQTHDGQFDTDVLVTARSSGNDSAEVDVAPNTEVLIVYGEGTVTTPRYRLWDGTNWGAEQSAQDVGGIIEWTETEAATTRDEYLAVTIDTNNDVNAQVYTASTTSWGNVSELSTGLASTTARGIDVAYETVSGDAVVVACDSGADPVYSIWNGSSWSATTSINVTTTSVCNQIRMASDPTSDEIIMVHRGVTNDYEAFVWNGSSWGDAQIIGRVGDFRAEGLTVEYEESGDQAVVVTTDATYNGFMYSTWNGTEWSTSLQVSHNADFETGILQRDDGTDQIALCMVDAQNDAQVIIWDGGSWGSFQELTATANTWLGRPIDCSWETTAGRDGYLMVPYADTGVDGDYHQIYNGSTWSGEQTGSDINDSYYVQTERAGDGTILATHFMDETPDELYSTDWNGTTWSNSSVIESDPAQINASPRQETVSMSAQIYQSAEGTVTSNPIDFDFVTAQPTWGDLTFSGSEPSGASLLTQIYYSSTTACDTLIPDGDLSGNSAGFLASSSPIDLSGLSTTTYNQICLEASLGLSGSQSATLDDWTLAWERTAKLEQHAFRWYDNLSNFTPTDPWPPGAEDLLENEVVGSENSIDNGAEIRLRMSLLGSNIALATSTQDFKLQYAAANSCSAATTWNDVGDIGSTTALWRGFANTIVGADWYDGNWNRRIEVTVDNLQVDEDLTDFPTYINLDDLPSGFFSNVQNDGDDIRVTKSDGLTEVPYELVSIDTGGGTGELHTKLDLASTTDTSFYIYYDNSSASGYVEGATYGAENVWTSNYLAVYHLEEDAGGVGNANLYIDSASGDYDGDDETADTEKDGQLGQGQGLNIGGTGDYIDLPYLVLEGETDVTQSWWHRSSSTGQQAVVSGATGPGTTGNNEYLAFFTSSTGFSFYNDAVNNPWTISSHTDDAWHAFTHLRDDTSNEVHLYVDGASDNENPDPLTMSAIDLGVGGLIVGQEQDNLGGGFTDTQDFEGVLDELRFADVLRSDGWISTEYNNHVNATGFYSVASEEKVSDGRQIPSTLLIDSTLRESYEEENPTVSNFNQIDVGDYAEWDFVVENNSAAAGTEYCFRMVKSDGATIDTYTQYPQLVTNGPPGIPVLLAPFDNEQLASTSSWFEFSADDDVGDEVAYQVQVDDDFNFGSVNLDRNSVTHFLEFESLVNGSDKSPFDSGSTIRFIPTSALSDNTTYWWRVRAQDPDGSGTYGSWSAPDSFTVDATTVITTWFQTTDEQFVTDTLTSATTTGSDSVQLDGAGGSSVGILDAFSTGTTKTISAGTDRLLVVGIHSEDSLTNVDVDTVTYGGQTLTQLQDEQIGTGFANGMWVGYLVDADIQAAVGTAINDTWIGGTPDVVRLYSAVVYDNVDQTTPVSGSSASSSQGVSSLQPSAALSVSDGDAAVYFTVVGAVGQTHTAASGYTEGTEQDSGGSGSVAANAYKLITGSGSEQPTADWTSAQNRLLIVSLAVSSNGGGSVVSTGIDYDDRDTGNAWGELRFNHTLNGGTIAYRIEYEVSTDVWVTIPDSALAGNEAGFTSSPVNIVTLDTDVYNTIRVVGTFGPAGTPQIDDWAVTWGEQVEKPTHVTPFDNAKVATSTPSLTFTTTDPDGDDLQYQLQTSTSSAFTSSSTFTSGVEAGFSDLDTPASSSPYVSGHTIQYAVQSALTSSSTYWWRVRARDPGGDNVFSQWSDPESFTVDESIAVSTWFQTTGDQFETNTNTNIETSTTSAQITSTITEAMVAYGESGALTPKYRIWDGSSWGSEQTALGIGALVEWAVLKPSLTRDEYALGTFGNDNDFNFQIYNGASSTWGNMKELSTDFDYTDFTRGFDLAYEQSSGDLMAVSCEGTEAQYSIWNGSTWSATTSINLQNSNDCYWVELAADPVSDEIIMAVRHTNLGDPDFELMVWDGSSWGNATTAGSMIDNDDAGIALEYEESGDQAMAVISNDINNNFNYLTWNGSSWTVPAQVTLGDNFEWGMIARDVGSDYLSLCYVDLDSDIGYVQWDGTNWGTNTEINTAAETDDGLPVSCQYMTDAANDGDVLITYSDNNNTVNEGGHYRISTGGAPGIEIDLGDVEDAWNVDTIRTADDLILSVFFDHNNGDRYDFTYWDGSSWATHDPTAISDTPSVTGVPFTRSLSMAPRVYPNFITGTIASTPIDYDDGTGPRWEDFSFTDTTPGTSYINYQVYYNTGTTTALVPDSYLPGNSTGTTTSSVSLALLDKTIHNELTLEADLVCIDGDCPMLEDWTVEWAEGITISGIAYEYDESTVQTSGSVAVVVNGVLQSGRTGTIAGDGTWSINNVTVFEDDTVVVFIDGVVADVDESIGVTDYDGNGDITGMNLSKRHVTIGSDDVGIVVNNVGLSGYDYTDNENLFFDIDGSYTLTVCGDSGCDDSELRVLTGADYTPYANTITHDFENNGTTTLATSTMRVSGSWVNNATTSIGTSDVIFTATSTIELMTGSSTLDFYNLTLGETSGSATWTVAQLLNIDGSLLADYGTLGRGASPVTIADDLTINANGLFSGVGTTTFDGIGISLWTDNTVSSSNIGHVVVDGTSKTITVSSDVRAESILINADDILRGGTTNTIYVQGSFTNTNSFVADTSDVTFIATSTAFITATGSSFYNLSFNGVGGIWAFTDSDIEVTNDFQIATGTITMPSATTTIGGSFTNATGTVAHNNGTLLFNSTSGGETVALASTPFLNAFYNVTFDGSGGGWTFA